MIWSDNGICRVHVLMIWGCEFGDLELCYPASTKCRALSIPTSLPYAHTYFSLIPLCDMCNLQLHVQIIMHKISHKRGLFMETCRLWEFQHSDFALRCWAFREHRGTLVFLRWTSRLSWHNTAQHCSKIPPRPSPLSRPPCPNIPFDLHILILRGSFIWNSTVSD